MGMSKRFYAAVEFAKVYIAEDLSYPARNEIMVAAFKDADALIEQEDKSA